MQTFTENFQWLRPATQIERSCNSCPFKTNYSQVMEWEVDKDFKDKKATGGQRVRGNKHRWGASREGGTAECPLSLLGQRRGIKCWPGMGYSYSWSLFLHFKESPVLFTYFFGRTKHARCKVFIVCMRRDKESWLHITNPKQNKIKYNHSELRNAEKILMHQVHLVLFEVSFHLFIFP